MLEYSFSTIKNKGVEQKILRTKGEKTNYLKGSYQNFSMENEDIKRFQNCKIEELIKTDTDSEGNFYSWYIISDFSETIDKSPEYDRRMEKVDSEIDFLFMINGQFPPDVEGDINEQNI